MISAPSNFNHISHMGPGDGIQIQRLMDLPTTLETADNPPTPIQHQQQQQGMQRVRSMLQSSASRFSPGQRAYPEPPRRSLSHQGAMPVGAGVHPGHYNGVSPPPGLPPRRPMVPPPMRPVTQPKSPTDHHHPDVCYTVLLTNLRKNMSANSFLKCLFIHIIGWAT